jgi:hypothetical protein
VCPILFPDKQVLACPATQRKGSTIRITLACNAHRVAGSKEASGGAVLIRDWRGPGLEARKSAWRDQTAEHGTER